MLPQKQFQHTVTERYKIFAKNSQNYNFNHTSRMHHYALMYTMTHCTKLFTDEPICHMFLSNVSIRVNLLLYCQKTKQSLFELIVLISVSNHLLGEHVCMT